MFTAITLSQSATGSSNAERRIARPALLTRMSGVKPLADFRERRFEFGFLGDVSHHDRA